MVLLNRLSRRSFDENTEVPPPPADPDGIDAFASEETLAASEPAAADVDPQVGDEGPQVVVLDMPNVVSEAPRPSRIGGLPLWTAIGAVVVGGLIGAGIWAYQRSADVPVPGTLTLQTTPSGMRVTIAGKPAGTTPVTMSLPAGEYRVQLAAPDGRQRDFPVTLIAGGTVIREVEMAPIAPPPSATGALRVESEPSRQMVIVDGVERGVSPVTVPELLAGEHVVVVRTAAGNVRRTINVREGETVSLVVSGSAEAPAMRAGWVSFVSPIPLELRENGRVVGTSSVERLMLPAGDHEIEMANDALGFRATRRVSIAADRTTSVAVDLPNGTVSINATPWAEVWLGGEQIGQTPIANLSRPIGTYEVLLRHPQFGERRSRVTVSVKQTTRLGVDMRTP